MGRYVRGVFAFLCWMGRERGRKVEVLGIMEDEMGIKGGWVVRRKLTKKQADKRKDRGCSTKRNEGNKRSDEGTKKTRKRRKEERRKEEEKTSSDVG